MVGKSQTTSAGRQRLRVVNFRLSLPPSSDQFSVITTSQAGLKAVDLFPDRFTRSGKNPKPNLRGLRAIAVQIVLNLRTIIMLIL